MTWMETFKLLGVDVFVVLLVVLAALDGIEHAVHTAWDESHKPR
jgi:hypothetical protein